jgi:amidohydrolase
MYAVHCDPAIDVGQVGLLVGPITAASDHIEVRLTGAGGHTARPHLTADLVTALGAVITQVPALLSRLVDPRAGVALVWGQVSAGTAANAIPRSGVVRGTLRTLSRDLWETLPPLVDDLVKSVASAYGVGIEISHARGVPPVVNDAQSVASLDAAVHAAVTNGVVAETRQSLGGEDFAWYLERVPGALARLGVRSPGSTVPMDLHQSGFDVDERCISVGVQLLAAVGLAGD